MDDADKRLLAAVHRDAARRIAYTIDKEAVEMRRSFYRLSALPGLTYDHTIR